MTETLRAVFGSTARPRTSRVSEHLDVHIVVGATRARREIAGTA